MLNLASIVDYKNIRVLKNFYVDISEINSYGFFNIIVYKNKKHFENRSSASPIAYCSFKIEEDYIRAVEETDFEKEEAILSYHQGLFVDPKYRRQKIATSIYILAEKITDLPIEQSTDVTNDAVDFWNQPDRPFGRD